MNQAAAKLEESEGGAPRSEGQKEVPKHFLFAPPMDQLSRYMNEHPDTTLDPEPFTNFLASRDWATTRLPNGAEGLVVVPQERGIDIHEYDYGAAARAAARGIRQECPWFREDFKRQPHTTRRLALMRQLQPFGFLLLAVQLGTRYRGCSGAEVQAKIDGTQEFGLGTLEIGYALRLNPGRLDSCWDLGIDAVGDTFHPDIMPAFSVKERQLTLHTRPVAKRSKGFAAATAFHFDPRRLVLI